MAIGTSDGETFNDRWEYVTSQLKGLPPIQGKEPDTIPGDIKGGVSKWYQETARTINEREPDPPFWEDTYNVKPGTPAYESFGFGAKQKAVYSLNQTDLKQAQYGPKDKDTTPSENTLTHRKLSPEEQKLWDHFDDAFHQGVSPTISPKMNPAPGEPDPFDVYSEYLNWSRRNPQRPDPFTLSPKALQKYRGSQLTPKSDQPIRLASNDPTMPLGASQEPAGALKSETGAGVQLAENKALQAPFGASELKILDKLRPEQQQQQQQQPVQIDNTHDVPYGAGASNSGSIVHIDKTIPQFDERLKTPDGQPADLHKYLAVHELMEKQAMDHGMTYEHAHTQIATPAERKAVEADGVDWKEYSDIIDGHLKKTEGEIGKNADVPSDLYLKPYPHKEQEILKNIEDKHPSLHKRIFGALEEGPIKSTREYLEKHPFLGMIAKSAMEAISLGGGPRGGGPPGAAAGTARPYFGINTHGEGFPINPQGRTYTFPSTPVRTTGENVMSFLMTQAEKALGIRTEPNAVAGRSAAGLRGQTAVRDVAQQEEAGALDREQQQYGRLLTRTDEARLARGEELPPRNQNVPTPDRYRVSRPNSATVNEIPHPYSPEPVTAGELQERHTGGGIKVADKPLGKTFTLEPAHTHGKEDAFTGETILHYKVKNENGEQVAHAFGALSPDGKTLYTNGLFTEINESHGIGYRGIRNLIRQVKKEYPTIEHIDATRISGARHGPAADKNIIYRSGFNMNVPK